MTQTTTTYDAETEAVVPLALIEGATEALRGAQKLIMALSLICVFLLVVSISAICYASNGHEAGKNAVRQEAVTHGFGEWTTNTEFNWNSPKPKKVEQ